MKKKIIGILAGTIILFALYYYMHPSPVKDGYIVTRGKLGEGEREIILQAEPEGEKDPFEISLPIESRGLSEEDAKKLLEKSRKKLMDEGDFLGENQDADHVSQSLYLPETLEGGLVKASWKFDNCEAISQEGKLLLETVPDQGLLVKGTLHLGYEAVMLEEEFYIRLAPEKYTGRRAYRESLREEAVKREKDSRSTSQFFLPQRFRGRKVNWTSKKDGSGLMILILGAASIPLLYLGKEKEEARKKEKKQCEYLRCYPEIVSEFAILLGAGMSLATAWGQIAGSRKGGVYKEMQMTMNEIRDGVSEAAAYEKFGNRCPAREYRKLAALLAQSLKRGTGDLPALIDREAMQSLEEHKSRVIKKGEEAGAKLLFPMIMLLVVVLVVLMVPAMFSFQL